MPTLISINVNFSRVSKTGQKTVCFTPKFLIFKIDFQTMFFFNICLDDVGTEIDAIFCDVRENCLHKNFWSR